MHKCTFSNTLYFNENIDITRLVSSTWGTIFSLSDTCVDRTQFSRPVLGKTKRLILGIDSRGSAHLAARPIRGFLKRCFVATVLDHLFISLWWHAYDEFCLLRVKEFFRFGIHGAR